jgi:hypothetical protein
VIAVVLVGWFIGSCAKQKEASQASEPASVEDAEQEKAAEGQAKPKQEAPGAAAPAAPAPPMEEASRGRSDLLKPEAEKAAEPTSIDDAMAELESSFSDLQKALQLSTPDCVTARQMRDRVCDLAEQICRLADESGGASSQRLCGDGRGRCSDARKRYDESCAGP